MSVAMSKVADCIGVNLWNATLITQIAYRAKPRQRRGSLEWKIDNLHLAKARDAVRHTGRECRACGIEAAFNVSEGDVATESGALPCTRDPADFFFVILCCVQAHARRKRRRRERNQAAQPLVPLARHLHSRNYLLADVAALLVINAARLQVRFHRNNLRR